MIFLWNPTKDDFNYQYGGLSFTIQAGKRKKVSEPEGNHVLNELGPRGLTRLVYDDDGKSINEDKIAEDAIERNKEFKIKQIYTYNERNERRKAAGQAYDPPTAIVKKWAAELGINLLKPYDMADGERGKIAELTRENSDLRAVMEKQAEDIKTMMETMKQLQEQISGGFVKAKDVAKDATVKCSICGEEVLNSRLASHMKFKHKEE